MDASGELASALVREFGDRTGIEIASALSKVRMHAARVRPEEQTRSSSTMSWAGGVPLIPASRLEDVASRANSGQLEFLFQLDCRDIPRQAIVDSGLPQSGILSLWLRPEREPFVATTSAFDYVEVYHWAELRSLEEAAAFSTNDPRQPLSMSLVETYPHIADLALERLLQSLGVDPSRSSRVALNAAAALDDLLDIPEHDHVGGHVIGGYAYGYNGSLSLCCQDLAERGEIRRYDRMSASELSAAHDAAMESPWRAVAQLDPQLVPSHKWDPSERILVMVPSQNWEDGRYGPSCLMGTQ